MGIALHDRPELMRKRVLELNASNERGIDVIRERTSCCLHARVEHWMSAGNKVKAFAQVAVGTRDNVA